MRKRTRVTRREGIRFNEEQLITYDEAFDRFIIAKKAEGLRPRTIKDYMSFDRYFKKFLREKKIRIKYAKEITPDLIRRYINHMQTMEKHDGALRPNETGGLAIGTINIRLRALKTMCKFWFKEGIIDDDIFENIKLLKDDGPEQKKFLTDDEIENILNSFDLSYFGDWRDYVLCLLLLDTGLRINEALNLKVEDINFKRKQIRIKLFIAKSREEREVPVSDQVLKEIKSLYRESFYYFSHGEKEFEHYVFYNSYGNKLEYQCFIKRLDIIKRKLGLKRLSPHMFRHTFIKNFIMNGGDIFTLQRIVGHKDIQTTRKYIQMNFADLKQQHNKFSPVLKFLK
jgi:integrase/recombinase XerD